MKIDLSEMQQHLEKAVNEYRKHGMRYGSAVFTTPEGLDEVSAQMGLAAFLSVLEHIGCVPFHMETKGSTIERAVLTLGNQEPREGAVRRIVYFRFMEDTEPAPPLEESEPSDDSVTH